MTLLDTLPGRASPNRRIALLVNQMTVMVLLLRFQSITTF